MSDSPRVALVNMPFSSSKYPSIQLGTLASLLKAQGIGVKTYHLYLGFAYQIGQPLYEVLCEKRGLLGEWLFSHLLFRDNPKNSEYSRTFKPIFESVARETGYAQAHLEELKLQGAPQYLTRMLTEIDWGQYTIVGFTSTCDQNVASLTMAKLIKDLYPSVTIVFGGANYDGEMGLEHLRAWPWIDYVVVGEGEAPFPALVKQVLDGKEHEEPPAGVAYRKDNAIQFKPGPHLFTEFHKTGPPDYDDYFELLDQLDPQRNQTLANGGDKSMQPCIESLRQNQLTEMKKGVSPLQNLQTLKWSLYYDIHLAWNILLGFPGESNEDYRRQLDLIPSILHFQPPEAVGEIWIERFSPYWKWPEQNGIRITGPGLAYEYVYDPRRVDLNKIAYDFEYELIEKRVDPSLIEELTRLTHEWQRLHATDDKPFLYYSKAMNFVTVFDCRAPDKPVKQRYDWPHAVIIEFCNDAPKYFGQIRGELNDRAGGAGPDEATVKQALGELLQKRILYEEKGRYFTLALPVNRTF